ncbi:MAG: menaquinone biosynthetic enzyme MqnA/MqnD family protein [Chitinophagaceae bacterium]
MNKIRIGAVSYLNTKPLLYGIKRSPLLNNIELIEDYPSRIAAMLLKDEIDVGLVPVAVLNNLPKYYLISDYCIGTVNDVASVSLFSHLPIDEIETVLLDYQSRTSVALVTILLKHYWKKDVKFINASENYINDIEGSTAGVIIGDRALKHRNNFEYNYDLANTWKAFTGLPFVFATWVANKPIDALFINEFNAANKLGLDNIDEVTKEVYSPFYDIKKYYTENISYEFDAEKKKALSLFLKYLKEI